MNKFIKLKNRIKANEGYRNKAYSDSLGFLTIGYGHLIRKNEKKLINLTHSNKQLASLFELDFKKAFNDYLKYYKKNNHNDRIKEIYIEMIFQLGIRGQLKFKKMNKYIEEDFFYMAAFEMKSSLWYKQTPKRVDFLINVLLKK